eukprot:264229_1
MSAIGAKRIRTLYSEMSIDRRAAKRRKLNVPGTTSSTTDYMVEYETYLHCLSHIVSSAIQFHALWKAQCASLRCGFPNVSTLTRYQTTISDALAYNTQTDYEHLKRVIITIHTNVPDQCQRIAIEGIEHSGNDVDSRYTDMFDKYFLNKRKIFQKANSNTTNLTHVPHLVSTATIFREMLQKKRNDHEQNEREIIVLSDDEDDDIINEGTIASSTDNSTTQQTFIRLDATHSEHPLNIDLAEKLPDLECASVDMSISTDCFLANGDTELSEIKENYIGNLMMENEMLKNKLNQKQSQCQHLIDRQANQSAQITQSQNQLLQLTQKNVTLIGQLNQHYAQLMTENASLKNKLNQKQQECNQCNQCKQLNNEVTQLKQQLQNKQAAIDTYKNVLKQVNIKQVEASQQIKKLEEELKEMTISRNQLQIIASSLQNVTNNGHEPRRQFIISAKCDDGIERTKEVKQWKCQLNEQYHNQQITNYTDGETITGTMNANIDTFLRINRNDRDYTNPVTTLNGLSLNNIAERFIITAPHRSSALIGQKGVRSIMDMPKNVVLSRYIGLEMTNKEWNDCFDYSNRDDLHGQYLYTFHLDEGKNITIDPVEGGKQRLLALYINDCRKDIFADNLTTEDKANINCAFVVVRVYGWPTVFVVTTKGIKKGDELLLDYGKEFWDSIKQNNRWNNIIQKVRKLSEKNIVKNVKLYHTHNGRESHDLTL